MRRFSAAEKRAYEKSNAVLFAPIAITPEMRTWATEIEAAVAAGNEDQVRDACQRLYDLLAGAAGVPPPIFKLKDTAYAKFRGGRAVWKLYGTCDPDGTITVAFKTAVRHQVFAFKTFFDTVIHEFMHHYDARGMKLARSFHTRGFYLRVRALRDALIS